MNNNESVEQLRMIRTILDKPFSRFICKETVITI